MHFSLSLRTHAHALTRLLFTSHTTHNIHITHHTHMHTHTLTLSHSHSPPATHTLSHTHTHLHNHTDNHTLSHTYPHTLAVTITLHHSHNAHSLTHTHSFTPTLSTLTRLITTSSKLQPHSSWHRRVAVRRSRFKLLQRRLTRTRPVLLDTLESPA